MYMLYIHVWNGMEWRLTGVRSLEKNLVGFRDKRPEHRGCLSPGHYKALWSLRKTQDPHATGSFGTERSTRVATKPGGVCTEQPR